MDLKIEIYKESLNTVILKLVFYVYGSVDIS